MSMKTSGDIWETIQTEACKQFLETGKARDQFAAIEMFTKNTERGKQLVKQFYESPADPPSSSPPKPSPQVPAAWEEIVAEANRLCAREPELDVVSAIERVKAERPELIRRCREEMGLQHP